MKKAPSLVLFVSIAAFALIFSCAGAPMGAEQYTARVEKLAADHAAALARGDAAAADSALKEFQAEDPAKHGLSGKDFTADQQARIAAAGIKVLAGAGIASGAELGRSFGEALGKDLGKGLGEFFGAFSKEFTDAFKKASDAPPEGAAPKDGAKDGAKDDADEETAPKTGGK